LWSTAWKLGTSRVWRSRGRRGVGRRTRDTRDHRRGARVRRGTARAAHRRPGRPDLYERPTPAIRLRGDRSPGSPRLRVGRPAAEDSPPRRSHRPPLRRPRPRRGWDSKGPTPSSPAYSSPTLQRSWNRRYTPTCVASRALYAISLARRVTLPRAAGPEPEHRHEPPHGVAVGRGFQPM
jgi:hypothetical protein